MDIRLSIRINVNGLIVQDNKILLIKFEDENGPHYNLHGGGVDAGESIFSVLKRECLEEANADVNVLELVGSLEYVPELHQNKFGPRQKIGLIFLCNLKSGSSPSMPTKPDPNQVAVEWLDISVLESPLQERTPIFPQIAQYLLERYAENIRHLVFQKCKLECRPSLQWALSSQFLSP